MKKSQLQQIIREEVRAVLREANEDVKDKPLASVPTGTYIVNWTNDNRSGWDEMEFDFNQQIKSQAMKDGDSPYWFWKSVASEVDHLFTRGDKVVSVIKK
jgi:hypothetical protein